MIYTWVTYLESRADELWRRIGIADRAGDEYHVNLLLRLSDRLEVLIVKAKIREEAR